MIIFCLVSDKIVFDKIIAGNNVYKIWVCFVNINFNPGLKSLGIDPDLVEKLIEG